MLAQVIETNVADKTLARAKLADQTKALLDSMFSGTDVDGVDPANISLEDVLGNLDSPGGSREIREDFVSAEGLSIVLSVGAMVLLLFGWQVLRRVFTVLLFLFLMLLICVCLLFFLNLNLALLLLTFFCLKICVVRNFGNL